MRKVAGGQIEGKLQGLIGRFGGLALMAVRSLPSVSAHGGLTRYLEEIRQFPMLEPQEAVSYTHLTLPTILLV